VLKYKNLYLFLGLLIFPLILLGQNASADRFNNGQPVLLDSSQHSLNFYDFGQNPAGLFDDEQRKSLQIRQYGEYTSGEYRLPFDAEESLEQHYFVRTIQPLTENDLFKGYFAYHRQLDQNILYLDQSENLGDNPYLFADSSTGDFELNGLYWAGEWAHRFNRNWQSGAMFYYNVDQRLKNVFPKPLNKHRNIHFNYGIQYQNQSWAAGLSYGYFDDQEKIEISKYNLEQDLTPVILKFRFSDLPVIERGKTSEERKISNSSHQFSFQIKKEFNAAIFMAYYSRYQGNAKIVDGGSKNISQGNYSVFSEIVQTQLVNNLSLFETRISYAYQRNDLKAQHPDFSFVSWKAPNESHQILASTKVNIWQSLPLYFDAGYTWNNENRVDLMSDNYWRIQNRRVSGKAGFFYKVSEYLEAAAWIGLNKTSILNAERSANAYSEYYEYLFKQPYTFYTQNTLQNTTGMQLVYQYGPMLDIEFFIARVNLLEKNKKREHLLFGLHTNIFIF